MKKRVICFCVLGGILLIALILAILVGSSANREFEGNYIEYKCDVKNFEFSTSIEIEKDGENFVKVKGNIFKYVTDPLTMYDMEGKKLAYAGDDYHLISQDSHAIFVDGSFTCEMVGLVDFWGESYEIYDKNQNKIAKVTFNGVNTGGQMYDMENNLIVDYSSNFFFNDFNVRISEKCELDEKTVLMIFCSYYSDQSYDASNE